MDRIQRGFVTHIRLLIEDVESGNALPNHELRFVLGKEGLAEYEKEVSEARAERDRLARSYPDLPRGNVTAYLKALRAAYDAVIAVNRAGDREPRSFTKRGQASYRKWRARRENAKVLQEAVEEAWGEMDPEFHRYFLLPRGAQDPLGPGHDHSVGNVYSSFEIPPAIPLTLLELEPVPELLDIPRYQQREHLLRKLEELEADRIPPASAFHLAAKASLRARAAG
jgi:hypothetical protein